MAILEFMDEPLQMEFDTLPRLYGIYRWDESCRSMHMHDQLLELHLIISGSGPYIIDNELCYTNPGDILICNSNVMHDETLLLPDQMDTYCIAMTGLKLHSFPPNTLLSPALHPVLPSADSYGDLKILYEMVHRYSQLPCGYALANKLSQAIVLIIYDLIKKHQQPLRSEESQLIRRVQQYINDHYMEDLTLTALAAQFHTSEYYLSHLFRRITSYTPMNYIMRRRIGEAQTLLIYTNQELVLIASQVGYTDSNYFSRIFKKIVGLPPSRYRQEWYRQMNLSKKQGPQTSIGHVTL